MVAGGNTRRPSTAFKPGTKTFARRWCVRRSNLQGGRRHEVKVSGVGVRQDRAMCRTRRHAHSSITRTLAGWELDVDERGPTTPKQVASWSVVV